MLSQNGRAGRRAEWGKEKREKEKGLSGDFGCGTGKQQCDAGFSGPQGCGKSSDDKTFERVRAAGGGCTDQRYSPRGDGPDRNGDSGDFKGIIRETKPDLVIAIDALSARSVRRLGTTIQLTDTGIQPGSGVGNHRHSLTEESLGVPVLAIGVPTVVGAAAIVQDTLSALIQVLRNSRITKKTGDWIAGMEPEDQYQLIRELLEPEFGPLYVTPPDIDQSVKRLSFTISEGIHQAVFEENGRE